VWHAKAAYKYLVGNPDEKIPQGRPARKWEDTVEI
jgi:hypothetical protein